MGAAVTSRRGRAVFSSSRQHRRLQQRVDGEHDARGLAAPDHPVRLRQVGQHEGHRVAAADAQPPQQVGRPGDPRQPLAVRPRAGLRVVLRFEEEGRGRGLRSTGGAARQQLVSAADAGERVGDFRFQAEQVRGVRNRRPQGDLVQGQGGGAGGRGREFAGRQHRAVLQSDVCVIMRCNHTRRRSERLHGCDGIVIMTKSSLQKPAPDALRPPSSRAANDSRKPLAGRHPPRRAPGAARAGAGACLPALGKEVAAAHRTVLARLRLHIVSVRPERLVARGGGTAPCIADRRARQRTNRFVGAAFLMSDDTDLRSLCARDAAAPGSRRTRSPAADAASSCATRRPQRVAAAGAAPRRAPAAARSR